MSQRKKKIGFASSKLKKIDAFACNIWQVQTFGAFICIEISLLTRFILVMCYFFSEISYCLKICYDYFRTTYLSSHSSNDNINRWYLKEVSYNTVVITLSCFSVLHPLHPFLYYVVGNDLRWKSIFVFNLSQVVKKYDRMQKIWTHYEGNLSRFLTVTESKKKKSEYANYNCAKSLFYKFASLSYEITTFANLN